MAILTRSGFSAMRLVNESQIWCSAVTLYVSSPAVVRTRTMLPVHAASSSPTAWTYAISGYGTSPVSVLTASIASKGARYGAASSALPRYANCQDMTASVLLTSGIITKLPKFAAVFTRVVPFPCKTFKAVKIVSS